MRTNKLLRAGGALALAVSMALSSAVSAAGASDDDLDYYVGGISENGYLVDDDDNYIDFDEAVCGPAAESDLRVPYGKTIYFPLLNDGTSGNLDRLYEDWQKAEQKLADAGELLEALEQEVLDAREALNQQAAGSGSTSAEAQKAEAAIELLEDMLRFRKRLDGWSADSQLDSGSLRSLLEGCSDELSARCGIFLARDASQEQISGEISRQQRIVDNAASSEQSGTAAYENWQNAVARRDAQMKTVEQAKKDAREAEQAYLDSTGSGDGYPFVHESQAVRHIKIKADWDEGKAHIDSLSITKKRYKNSPYAAESGVKRYAYFLAIEIKDRDSTSTSVKDVSGTVKLKKTSGSHRFDYDDVQADFDFEIGFNPPEDSNVIPIDPALFEPDEDFDEDTDEEFEFEADGDSYYVANTKNQKKIVLGLDTDYDDEIGDRYEYANLSFWNGNGASFSRSGYLYLCAGEDDSLYAIDDDGDLKLLHPDYDHYEDCFVIRTRTLGRYVASDRRLQEVSSTTEDDDPDITVIYDVNTGVNYNPATGGYGADDDELWNTPVPADTTVFSNVLTRGGMLAKPESAPETSSPVPEQQEISAAVTALTAENPLAPPSPVLPAETGKAPMGRNTLILLCILAAEAAVALTSLVCYFAIFRRRHD